MYGGAINADILKSEIDGFLSRVANYRKRLVVNTCRADYSFQLGVFGFQHFINDFTKGLGPSIGLDMVDVLNVNNHLLLDRARRTLPLDTAEGAADMARLSELCETQYEHAPLTKRFRSDDAVKGARAALERYMDASILLFSSDMKRKGFSAGLEDMEHVFAPVKGMLTPSQEMGCRHSYRLKG